MCVLPATDANVDPYNYLLLESKIDQAKKEEVSTKTPADLKFEEMQQYANNLDIQMQNVARHTTALVKKQEQLGSTMFEFGVAFSLLANVSGLLAMVHATTAGRKREKQMVVFSMVAVVIVAMRSIADKAGL